MDIANDTFYVVVKPTTETSATEIVFKMDLESLRIKFPKTGDLDKIHAIYTDDVKAILSATELMRAETNA